MGARKSLTASVAGALLGLGGILIGALWFWLGPNWLIWMLIPLAIGQTVWAYIQASFKPTGARAEWMRGLMIGNSAGLNGAIFLVLGVSDYVVWPVVILLAIGSWLRVSRHPFYHTIIGWLNFILPMSWPVNIPGFIMFALNTILSPLGYVHPLLRAFRVENRIEWHTGAIVQLGGVIRPVPGFVGLNMGNFIFLRTGHDYLIAHETGHLFSLATLGFVFHYVGGIDEHWFQRFYWQAYAEHIAESYNTPSLSGLSMWK